MKMPTSAILSFALMLMCVCTQATADPFGSGANQFEIEFVTIGSPGNAADTTGAPDPAGSVDYVYRIGKYEISRDMVEKANAEGDLEITLHAAFPVADMPASGVSWNEAARFTNWLNMSQGFPAAYKFSTQPGEAGYDATANIELWVDGDPGFDAGNPFRNSQSHYFLPSVHEWYKAAYYDPSANGGAGGYWDYPTGNDTVPRAVARGTDPNTAVYYRDLEDDPAEITQAGGLSPYAVMGLGGNVIEWEETEWDLTNDDPASWRGLRGGHLFTGPSMMTSSARVLGPPSDEDSRTGFRVASIPEPSLVGDFNNNGVLDAGDIDMLTWEPRTEFDVTGDGLITQDDREYWVHRLANTYFGDADVNGEFNIRDLVQVLGIGKYETQQEACWSEGDWNGDGIFGTGDLVTALIDGGYEIGSRQDAPAVPEPAAWVLCLVASGGCLSLRKVEARVVK